MKRIISVVVGAALGALPSLMATAQPFAADVTNRISFAEGLGSGGDTDADVINPQMSKNGRFVVFESSSTNLVARTQEQDPVVLNGKRQVYLYDRQANSIELVSVTMDGHASPVDCYEPTVSNDGRFVAFVADLRDGADTANPSSTGRDIFAGNFDKSVGPNPSSSELCQKGDCNQNYAVGLFFPGRHILVRDRLANTSRLVSLAEIETARQKYENGVPKVTANTVELVREKLRVANTRYDVVVGDLGSSSGPNRRQRGDSSSSRPFISGDGRYIVYDTDGFTGAGYRVSTIQVAIGLNFNVWTVLFNGVSYTALFGEDGEPNTDDDYLLPGPLPIAPFFDYSDWLDSNGVRDVYVRDGGESPSTKVVSFDCKYHQPRPLNCTVLGSKDSLNPSISDDGKFITY